MFENIEEDHHHVGEFQLDGETLPGEMIYNRKNGVVLLCIKRTIEGFGRSYGRLNTITGRLTSGIYVTLFNNDCTQNHTESFHIQHLCFRSEYVVWSKANNPMQTFNKLVCVVQNGLAWGGMSQINDNGFDGITYKGIEQEKTYDWYGAKIRFSTTLQNGLWQKPREEVCKIIERLEITIESDEKQTIDYFLRVRNCVLALICFAIKDNINIDNQYLEDYDDYYFPCKDIKECYHHHIVTSEPYDGLQGTHQFMYNFSLSQLPIDENLADKLNKLAPVFNLYASLYKYPYMPTEMIFLNVVQALETFHSRFFYDDKKSKYIKSVSSRFESNEDFEIIKKLLLSEAQIKKGCNYIILLSRLNDMLIGKYDGLFSEFYLEDDGYAQRIVDTRHYYTHYGKSKEKMALKGDELIDAISIMRLLLEYNVCLTLGVDIRNRVEGEIKRHFRYKKIDETNNPIVT